MKRTRRAAPGRFQPIPDLTPDDVARFYGLMTIGGCGMLWGGETNNDGYGRFPIWRGGERVRLLAHRVSFKLATGKDPGQMVIRHGCDTPPCCTPDCFRLGTQADNVHDMIVRRRLDTTGLSTYRAIRIAQTAVRTGARSKVCTRCNKDHRLADFDEVPGNPDGRAYWCRLCVDAHLLMPTRMSAGTRLQMRGQPA